MALVAKVQEVEGVLAAAPLIIENGLLSSDARSGTAALIHGIDPQLQDRVTSLSENLERGADPDGPVPKLSDLRTSRPAGRDGSPQLATVFLGKELKHTLHVKIGDRIRLIVPQARLSPFAVRPKNCRRVSSAIH